MIKPRDVNARPCRVFIFTERTDSPRAIFLPFTDGGAAPAYENDTLFTSNGDQCQLARVGRQWEMHKLLYTCIKVSINRGALLHLCRVSSSNGL